MGRRLSGERPFGVVGGVGAGIVDVAPVAPFIVCQGAQGEEMRRFEAERPPGPALVIEDGARVPHR
jgi:hypothetical protein